MPYLIIETSTEKGMIACIEGKEILFFKELPCGQNQSKYLMPELQNCLKEGRVLISQLDGIGVGVGPGSYTGIRVGAAVAQALAFSWNIPLIGISSLNGFVPHSDSLSFAAVIDARIGGVYIRKGVKNTKGIQFITPPEVCSLEQLAVAVGQTSLFVTPNSSSLRGKIDPILKQSITWEERYPCVWAFVQSMEEALNQGQSVTAGNLELMYLRKTEAERQKEMQNPSLFN